MSESLAALSRGLAFEDDARPEEALASYLQATAMDPGNGRAWRQVGNLFRKAGRLFDASECFERALAAGDNPARNKFFLSAVGVGAVVSSVPSSFVEALFDQYAARFEEHLTSELRYNAPALLRRVIFGNQPKSFQSLLDLGCGTGLSGRAFRKDVCRLTGIDLSERMLYHAKRSGAYDCLVRAELCQHLNADKTQYNIIICCDALIYIGDLSNVFEGVRRILCAGGVLDLASRHVKHS